jgi:hypothetical protein
LPSTSGSGDLSAKFLGEEKIEALRVQLRADVLKHRLAARRLVLRECVGALDAVGGRANQRRRS